MDGGSYSCEFDNQQVHPYLSWLVEKQKGYKSQLDLIELLEPNREPDIAAQRINKLTELIIDKL